VTGVARSRLSSTFLAKTGTRAGDLGDLAQSLRGAQRVLSRPAALTIAAVLEGARALAKESGQGSAARRKREMVGLLRGCREAEQETRFLVRFFSQVWRLESILEVVKVFVARGVMPLFFYAWVMSSDVKAACSCRASIAHIRQSRPDHGLGFQVKVIQPF
jgi:ATP-dependent DNA ligase